MVLLKYSARLGSESKVDKFTEIMLDRYPSQCEVNFKFDSRYLKSGFIHAPDYGDRWVEYNLCSSYSVVSEDFGDGTPTQFKGIVLDLEEECDPLWLAFGKYHEDTWICQNITRTYAAGYPTHVMAVGMLRGVEPLVDEFWVLDDTGLWKHKDLERGYREYVSGLDKLRMVSEMLTKADIEYGHVDHMILPSKRLHSLSGAVSGGDELASSTLDPHWLRPTRRSRAQ